MNNNSVPLTILTSTYNRGGELMKLYRSLLKQTNYQFQWLVIDDGSTDGTEQKLKSVLDSQVPFTITYVRKNNGGKHTAINYSHKHIMGKYLVIIDSDDYLSTNAVDTVMKEWNLYSKDNDIVGITFQMGSVNGKVFDPLIKGEYISDFATEMNRGLRGDHCETVRTDYFKDFMFPVFRNERFVAEAAMWYLITKHHKVVYSDKIICYSKYLENGLTSKGRKLFLDNPKGAQWHARVFLSTDFNFKIRLKNALLFSCYSILQHEKSKDLCLKHHEKTMTIISWPFGFLLYEYWKHRYIRS